MLYMLFMMGTHGRQRLNKLYRQFKNTEKPTGIILSVIFAFGKIIQKIAFVFYTKSY